MASSKLSKKPLTVKGIEAAIKAAKIDQKGREIGDALLPSFYCSIQRSGHAAFVLRYRHGKQSRKWTIGSYPKLSLEESRQLAREATGDVARGIDVAAQKKVRRTKAAAGASQAQTVNDLIKAFLTRYVATECKPNTAACYERWLRKASERWGDRGITDIKRADIRALHDEIAKTAPVLANRVLSGLSKMFAWSVDQGLLDANPASQLAKKKERARSRALSDGELRLLLDAADKLPGSTERDFVHMLVLTMQRRSEVAGMAWDEVDLPGKIWVLPAWRAKNGREHRLPLSGAATSILQARPRTGPYVFSNVHGAVFATFGPLKTELDRLITEANGSPIPEWVLHDLRRSGASCMPRLGVSLPVTERLLNHTSGSFADIVAVYQTYDYLKEMRKAMERWATHLVRIRGGNVIEFRSRA